MIELNLQGEHYGCEEDQVEAVRGIDSFLLSLQRWSFFCSAFLMSALRSRTSALLSLPAQNP